MTNVYAARVKDDKVTDVITDARDLINVDSDFVEIRELSNKGDTSTLRHLANMITDAMGENYIFVDNGQGFPRYGIVRAPHVGDPVSKAFNGDYYPVGTVVKVTPTLGKVVTSSGDVFYRRKQTAKWLEVGGGPFTLIQGTVDQLNEEF